MLTTAAGRCIRFSVDEVRVFASRDSTGVRGVKLADGDEVISMAVLRSVDATPAAATAAAEQPAEAASSEPVAFSEQDIETRVAHIRALMQDDQQEEAVTALRELQQGAPDLTLPDDLQELAQQNPAS